MVEKIKQSRKLEKYVIINFSSLKKYTTESSRPPPLVVTPVPSIVTDKSSKSPAILHPNHTESCCSGDIEMEIYLNRS